MEAAADDVRDEVALVLCLAATAIAAGCGSPSDSTVEQQVAKTMAATSGHAVSKVSCTKGIADPPAGTPPSTAAEFTEAHSAPNRFIVLPGHTFPDVERIVASHDRYEVVEKVELDIDALWQASEGSK